MFEPGTRNTGTAVAGRNIANPVAMLNASCDLLEHLGLNNHATMIRDAIIKTLCIDRIHTSGKLDKVFFKSFCIFLLTLTVIKKKYAPIYV